MGVGKKTTGRENERREDCIRQQGEVGFADGWIEVG